MHLATPIPVKIWVSIELAWKPFELQSFENVPIFLEKQPYSFYQNISLPMGLHTSDPHIDLTVALSIHFPMDVNVQQRKFTTSSSPLMQSLVKRTRLELLFQQIVGVNINFADQIRHSPYQKRVLACPLGEVHSKEGSVNLTLMDPGIFVVLLATPSKPLGVRSSEQDGTLLQTP